MNIKYKFIGTACCIVVLFCSTPALAFNPLNLRQHEITHVFNSQQPLLLPPNIWIKSFGGISNDIGYSVQQTTDGGYIIVGLTYSFYVDMCDVWLIKTDKHGNEVWNTTFGGKNTDFGISVQQTTDGGYIITGLTQTFSTGLGSVWLIKTDEQGEKIWDKTFGGTKYDGANAVQQTSDGGYIITGYTTSFGAGDADVWLIKTDEHGNRVWDITFGEENYDYGESVLQTSDGGYIIIGLTQSFDAGLGDVWLIKTDGNGTHIWDKIFGGGDIDYGISLRQTTDGGYIITGLTQSFGAGSADVWLIKTDAHGDKIWDTTFGGIHADCGYSVQQTTDDGYIITGSTQSFGAGLGDVWMIKTDRNGSKMWDKTFGGIRNDEGYSIQQTNDGGYIITGLTQPSDTDVNYDLWLIKTDSQGKGISKSILGRNFWFDWLFHRLSHRSFGLGFYMMNSYNYLENIGSEKK